MIRDRGELEQNIKEAIEEVKYKRKNIEQVNSKLKEFDVPPGFFNELIKKENLLGEIDASLLCLLSIALFEVSGKPNYIRPENYFTEGEIEESKKHKLDKNQDSLLPITLSDVIRIDGDRFITKIQMTELVKWYHAGLIVYGAEAQRGLNYVKSRSGIVPVPIVNKDSVKEISEKMSEESFFTDTIRINIYAEDFEPVIYNPKTRMLTIKQGTTINILDGFHRLQGAVRAVLDNPELSLVEELSICIYDIETQKKFFGQINKQNPIDPARLSELSEEKVSFAAVKQLKLHSDLKGRIASGSKVNEIAGHLTTESILANAIEDVFDPKNTPQANAIGSYLCEFFNQLLNDYKDELKNKESIFKHPRMFIGYVVIAKHFKDNDIPLDKIKETIDNLNMTQELCDTISNNRGTPTRLQRNVREYFEKLNFAVGV